jgi:hypothetical protein
LKAHRVATARKAVQARIERKIKQKKDLVDDSLPVTADEPTYCYCNNVSYGEMIACENEVFNFLELLMIVLSQRMVSSGMRGLDCCAKREMVVSRL